MGIFVLKYIYTFRKESMVMNPPYRTGITSLKKLAKKTCKLLTLFIPLIKANIPPAQHVYVDALNQACADFVQFVDNPRP